MQSANNPLQVVIDAQYLQKDVMFVEVDYILNSKRVGYVSSNMTDLDLVTPNNIADRVAGRLPLTSDLHSRHPHQEAMASLPDDGGPFLGTVRRKLSAVSSEMAVTH